MLNQSQLNKVIHDWIQLLTNLNGSNIRPQRNRFGFNLVDNTGKPLAFDTTLCMFYAGLNDEIIDKEFINYDSVSMLKSVSVSLTFIGEDADTYATMIQSLAYGITSRAFLRNYGFALYGNITEAINDKEYSEKWYYRRTLNITFSVIVDFKPQNAPAEFNINTVPINVLNNEGIAEAPEIPPIDPVQYYKENRNPNWLNMLGTGFGENYDEMEQYYESQNNEIRLLFLLYPPNDNLIAFTVFTQRGQYTVSYTQADGTQVTRSLNSSAKFEANLDYNDFGYEFDMKNNVTGTGTRQVLITITGNNITNFSLSSHSLRPSSSNYNRWNIAEFMGKCTYMTSLSVDYCNMVYFTLFGNNNITDIGSDFANNYLLEAVLQLNTSNVTNMNNMFGACYNLQSIPNLNTSNVTSMNSMFSSCYNLQAIPVLDTSNVTNMYSMFSGCYNLQSIPNLNTSNVTSMNSMFSSCYNLQAIPVLDTSNVTNMSSMFGSCYSLKAINLTTTKNVTSYSSAFNALYSCTKITGLDFSGYTSSSQISLANMTNLSQLQITATNWAGANITINNCSLGYEALLTLLENLPPVTANPTFTMTNNIGSDQLASEVSSGNPPKQYTKAVNNGWIIAL